MSILINKDTKVITQGITGKTGQFHTKMSREYANGKNCYVAGVTPGKGGQDFEGIPIYNTVKDDLEKSPLKDADLDDTVGRDLEIARGVVGVAGGGVRTEDKLIVDRVQES